MIRSEFERAKKELKIGDKVCLTLRGNYGEYQEEGVLQRIGTDGFVYLDKGVAHSYTRIISMCRLRLTQ